MGFFSRLKNKLTKTSTTITESLKDLAGVGGKLNEDQLQNLEDSLIMADVGVETAANIISHLRRHRFEEDATDEDIKTFLANHISTLLQKVEQPLTLPNETPAVLLMVGVNGSGKTTTLGKMASQFKQMGKNVTLVAGDTFRAGAIEQLKIWSDRANVPIITPEKEGADAAGLIFNAYEEAQQNNTDILMCDTAGRLQNRQDLMDELSKVVRVIQKKNPAAPHATLLVIDATVGQNALSQVEAFKDIAGITGLIVTKLDSSAKGGIIIALAEKFTLPIHMIGVGESLDDLQPFNARDFARALVG